MNVKDLALTLRDGESIRIKCIENGFLIFIAKEVGDHRSSGQIGMTREMVEHTDGDLMAANLVALIHSRRQQMRER